MFLNRCCGVKTNVATEYDLARKFPLLRGFNAPVKGVISNKLD